jgi:hypothetical protein
MLLKRATNGPDLIMPLPRSFSVLEPAYLRRYKERYYTPPYLHVRGENLRMALGSS